MFFRKSANGEFEFTPIDENLPAVWGSVRLINCTQKQLQTQLGEEGKVVSAGKFVSYAPKLKSGTPMYFAVWYEEQGRKRHLIRNTLSHNKELLILLTPDPKAVHGRFAIENKVMVKFQRD